MNIIEVATASVHYDNLWYKSCGKKVNIAEINLRSQGMTRVTSVSKSITKLGHVEFTYFVGL